MSAYPTNNTAANVASNTASAAYPSQAQNQEGRPGEKHISIANPGYNTDRAPILPHRPEAKGTPGVGEVLSSPYIPASSANPLPSLPQTTAASAFAARNTYSPEHHHASGHHHTSSTDAQHGSNPITGTAEYGSNHATGNIHHGSNTLTGATHGHHGHHGRHENATQNAYAGNRDAAGNLAGDLAGNQAGNNRLATNLNHQQGSPKPSRIGGEADKVLGTVLQTVGKITKNPGLQEKGLHRKLEGCDEVAAAQLQGKSPNGALQARDTKIGHQVHGTTGAHLASGPNAAHLAHDSNTIRQAHATNGIYQAHATNPDHLPHAANGIYQGHGVAPIPQPQGATPSQQAHGVHTTSV